jgi:hypothetical protein
LITDPDPALWAEYQSGGFCQKLKKLIAEISYFLIKVQFFLIPRPLVQATEEPFSPQKGKSITSKHEIFSIFGGLFALLDPDLDPLT